MNDFELAKQYFFDGLMLLDDEDFIRAEHKFKKSLELIPDRASTLTNLSVAQFRLKKYSDAKLTAEKAILLDDGNSEAYLNLGLIEKESKNLVSALNNFKKAIIIKSDYAQAWSNKGAVLNELKRYDEAIAQYDKALSLKLDYHEAWTNKGFTLHELKRFDEAIAHYDKALEFKPDYYEAWGNKGVTLYELKRFDEAITHYDMAISLKPDYHEAWSNKGKVLNQLKRFDEAIAHFNKALSLKSDIDGLYGDLLHTKMKVCSWSGFDESLKNLTNKVQDREKIAHPFLTLALDDDPVFHKQCAEIYAQDIYPFNPILGSIPKRPKRGKMRIGYFSADFGPHAVSVLTAELFELHDKDQFEIIAFSFGVDNKSPMRLRLRDAFNEFVDVDAMTDKEIARLARELNIDIAVDLGGYTAESRAGIFAYRAAPIQLGYIGYLGTMGNNYTDYILADATIIPKGSEQYYSEKIAYLPSYQVNDRKRIISDNKFTRQTLGLPDKGFIFCCFNNNYKILPATFDGWMRILKAVDCSVLFLYADNPWAEVNLRKEAEVRGVSGKKLVFGKRLPADEYLARYRVCDLFLDTSPYNAGTTASDALWVGLPVLTLIGKSFAARVAASLLNAIGLPELVTNTQDEFEALAIELAINPKKLADIKLILTSNRLTTPLFDTPLFAKNLEAAYIKIYERYHNDLKPEHIFIT